MLGNGIDIAIKAIVVIINNYFNDYKKLKNEITSLQNISNYFLGFKYCQVDLSLNYIVDLVQDRCNDVFLTEINGLVNNIYSKTISLNIVIIIFIFISALIIVFFIIKNILGLDDLVLNSTSRINRSICYIKIQNLSN